MEVKPPAAAARAYRDALDLATALGMQALAARCTASLGLLAALMVASATNRYLGEVTVAEALAESINTVAAQVAQRAGQHAVEIADAGRQVLHLAEAAMDLLQSFTDLLEGGAQPLFQRGNRLVRSHG